MNISFNDTFQLCTITLYQRLNVMTKYHYIHVRFEVNETIFIARMFFYVAQRDKIKKFWKLICNL